MVRTNTDPEVGIDLSLCSELAWLRVYVEPGFGIERKSVDMFRAMLDSWTPDASNQELCLYPMFEAQFTRQKFAGVLGTVGAVAEQWLESNGGRLGLDERARTDGLRGVVQIRLHDLDGWWEWWCTRIRDSFPTFAKFDGLGLDYVLRE